MQNLKKMRAGGRVQSVGGAYHKVMAVIDCRFNLLTRSMTDWPIFNTATDYKHSQLICFGHKTEMLAEEQKNIHEGSAGSLWLFCSNNHHSTTIRNKQVYNEFVLYSCKLQQGLRILSGQYNTLNIP